jgi:hypothetical protein
VQEPIVRFASYENNVSHQIAFIVRQDTFRAKCKQKFQSNLIFERDHSSKRITYHAFLHSAEIQRKNAWMCCVTEHSNLFQAWKEVNIVNE